jgi:hypothetical protein
MRKLPEYHQRGIKNKHILMCSSHQIGKIDFELFLCLIDSENCENCGDHELMAMA